MSNVVGLGGPTVATILQELNEQFANGNLTHIAVATLDRDLMAHCASSQMTNERAVWLSGLLARRAWEEQA